MDDIALPQHHRAGAHRARRHPVVTTLLALGSVAVVSGVLVWFLLAVDVLGVRGELVAGVQSDSSASPDPSASPVPSVPATGPSPSAEPVPSESVVDVGVPLAVLNSTGTSGLAAGAAERLEEAGWTVDRVGNYPGGELPTTVFYGADELAATADAVAGSLGTGRAALSADVDDGELTVVLGPDYEG